MISIPCRKCNREVEVNVTVEEYTKWANGAFIQDAMPRLAPAHREMFISGFCGICWDEMFGGNDE